MNINVAENVVLDKFTAVDFLVEGSSGRILLNNIPWDLYETFIDDFAEKPGWKLAYNGGTLEIMPPTPEHEEYSFSFHNFVLAYCEHFNIELEGRRSTTFRSKSLDKGVEPDECYYIQSVDKIIGEDIAAKEFPVPDVAVEVDISTESLDKFPIYSELKVSEVWIFNREKLTFYELRGGNYHQIENSLSMPKMNSKDLLKFLKLSNKKGQTSALREFRKWLTKIN